MSRPEEYLEIPADYGRWLGVRWSVDREAIEQVARDPSVGLTLVMAGEIAAFLEGFHAVRSSINFAYVLHLLKLLNRGFGVDDDQTIELPLAGSPGSDGTFVYLEEIFQRCGRPLRNAGFLFGHLCRDVPRVPDPPDLVDLSVALQGRFSGASPLTFTLEEPSLEPEEFEERVRIALRRLVEEGSLEHWLRHGRGPIGDAGEKVAEEAEAVRPRTLIERLEALGERPRLSVAASLVPHLDGALVLPSRRLAPAALPVGGYSDVTTRGQPEQILPAQFALDDLEFLRRFAARELLYFHREEPRSAVEEELVLVMDQGVRTWGDVRLVLSAAGMALARRSARRGVRLLVASSGSVEPVPALDIDDETLAARFETSDLSTTPAEALERVLESPAERQRDIVLLTHPRALDERDVREAAGRVEPGTRLFAVAVDAAGQVTLAELRRGVAVPLSTCRVTITPAEPREPASGWGARTPWRGDVEPIGFPFRLGVLDPIDEERFTFEHGGRWLLAASPPLGLLYAWKIDDATMEILPRPIWNGMPLSSCRGVLGVNGGFVVWYQVGNDFYASHYDLHARTCVVHMLGPIMQSWWVDWTYHPDLHTITARNTPRTQYFSWDLSVGLNSPRALEAVDRIALNVKPKGGLADNEPPFGLPPGSCIAELDRSTGTIRARGDSGRWRLFTPVQDGKPALKDGAILQVRGAGKTLGLLVQGADGRKWVECFAEPDGRSLGAFYVRDGARSFALSSDGRLAAHRLKQGHIIQVREVASAGPPKLEAHRAKFHPRLEVRLGKGCLVIRAGWVHILRWNRGPLEIWTTSDPREARREIGKLGTLETAWEHHPREKKSTYLHTQRFVARAQVPMALGLDVVVDAFGHVAVFDVAHKLVAMFLVVRADLAAWLPDGTMLGPDHLIGGPPTPGASVRIGEVLNKAVLRSAARGAAIRRGGTHK